METTGATESKNLNPWDSDSYFHYRGQDISGAEWTVAVSGKDTTIAGDHLADVLFSYWIPGPGWFTVEKGIPEKALRFTPVEKGIPEKALLYLRTWNTQKEQFLVQQQGQERETSLDEMPELKEAIARSNRIYSNGGAEVLGQR